MLKELWIDFGVNNHHQYISAHGIAKALGKEKTETLPFFHAFTGCDTVSSFNGILESLTKTFQE